MTWRSSMIGTILLVLSVVTACAQTALPDDIEIERPEKPQRLVNFGGLNLLTNKSLSFDEDLKGHVVVIDVWATWCIPCVKEIPELVKFQEKHKEDKFTYLGISVDDPGDEKDVIKFAKNAKVNYPIMMMTRYLFDDLGKAMERRMTGIPTKIVIGRGKVAFFIVGPPSLNEKIHETYQAELEKLIAVPVPKDAAAKTNKPS
ncbi:MAG: TlpA disulfide reductase family protein [Candidatus Poribacteria bacterium]|nr:TlpA disulfide reductase family protein [Candidatus Poribacteria bacterium]